jgi:spore coat polysaccharide biosynthesis predicted glycosyltransferase SpsG
LIFVLVENQSRTAKGLEQLGIGRDLGTARPLDRKAFIEVLHDLAHDRKSRQRMAKNAFNAVDNKGTARIVDLIEEEFM